MKVLNLTDDDLRIAIAQALGWQNIHRSGDALYGMYPGMWTFAPLIIAEWSSRLEDALQLEILLQQRGMGGEYEVALLEVLGINDANAPGAALAIARATPRQRSEAAIAVLAPAGAVT